MNKININNERAKSITEKWFPVLCSDEEYKEKYGTERSPIGDPHIIIEGQQSYVGSISNTPVKEVSAEVDASSGKCYLCKKAKRTLSG